MTAQTKAVLKTYFQRGRKPTADQFGDLIDSFIDVSAGSGGSFSPTSTTPPANGLYLAGSNQVGISATSALALSVGYYVGTGTPENSIQFLNSGSGFFPAMQAIGSAANLGLVYVAKGNAFHAFNTNGPQTGSPVTQFGISHTANANNHIDITGSNGGQPTLSISGADANAGYIMSGTGVLTVPGVNAQTTGNAANVNVDTSGNIKKSTSSLRYKRNVRDYECPLDRVDLMRPVLYKSKMDSDGDRDYAGFIAEEIEEIGLTEFVTYDVEGRPDGLMYPHMVSLLIGCIKDLRTRVKSLESA